VLCGSAFEGHQILYIAVFLQMEFFFFVISLAII